MVFGEWLDERALAGLLLIVRTDATVGVPVFCIYMHGADTAVDVVMDAVLLTAGSRRWAAAPCE